MGSSGVSGDNPPCTVNIPIAPIHSPAQAMSPTQSIGLVQSLLANQNIQLDVLTNPTATAAAAAAAAAAKAAAKAAVPDHNADSVTAQYTVPARYSSPGQVIFSGLEMGNLSLNGTLPPPPHHLPPQPHQQHQQQQEDHHQTSKHQQQTQIQQPHPKLQQHQQTQQQHQQAMQHHQQHLQHQQQMQSQHHQQIQQHIQQQHQQQMQQHHHQIQQQQLQQHHQQMQQQQLQQQQLQQQIHQQQVQHHHQQMQQQQHQMHLQHEQMQQQQQQIRQQIQEMRQQQQQLQQQHQQMQQQHQQMQRQHQQMQQQLKMQISLPPPPSGYAPISMHQLQMMPTIPHPDQPPERAEQTHTLKVPSRPQSFIENDNSLEMQMRKMNPPPPYPGTVVSAATAGPPVQPGLIGNGENSNTLSTDPCLSKDAFSLHPVSIQYPTPLGYERITTFDSSGNVEEVCRPRRRLIRNQNAYGLQGMGSSATLKVTSSENKKVQLPYSSATLSRLSVPRYSIPSGDPPPYPEPANQINVNRSPTQRIDSSLIHATLRRDHRENTLKVPQMVDTARTLPTKSKVNNALALPYQPRIPTALYTCTQCSSNSSSTSVSVSGGGSNSSGIAGGTVVRQDFPPGKGAQHSTIIVHSKSASTLASQSSYNLLSPVDNSRDRTVYINSAFTEDETLNQQCHLEKSMRHLTLGDVGLTVKRPPPYQWDSPASDQIWMAQDPNMLTSPPGPHKPPHLLLSQAQHLDITRLPFVLSTKPPSSPSSLTLPSPYQISLSPFPPGVGHSSSQFQSLQSTPQPCGPSDMVTSIPFSQQDPTVVLPPGYANNLASLPCCPLPPMYPGASSCTNLQLHPMALHPWSTYSACPPMQDHSATLPSKMHQSLEKPILSPPPPPAPPPPPPPPPPLPPPPPPSELMAHQSTSEVLADSGESFQEQSSLNESPVQQGSDRFSKKSRKRLDSRPEEAGMSTVSETKTKKEGRTLADFNSLIASPRLGSREKKKPKGQKEQMNKAKKLSRTTNEFQDSSESEPELFISGDELMNQSQSSKKGWKSKRSLRTANELEEIKCRKANEREDRSLGSQGFVYVMANKQPLWNEATQVYQLDFGGRVTQESAKNFQIELDGRQVSHFLLFTAL